MIGGPWDKNRLCQDDKRFSRDGMTLVKKQWTFCPHPPRDEFTKDKERNLWRVPAVVCRQCPFHRARNARHRFPICTFRGTENKAEATVHAIAEVNKMFQTAVDVVADITGERAKS
jgi:hypothetical protein